MRKSPNINANKHMVEKLVSPETPKSEFTAKLEARWKKGNFVCVGLDSDLSQIPQSLKDYWWRGSLNPTFETIIDFNKSIIGATADLVCAYKPNIAFYEEQGEAGLAALRETIRFIKKQYPDIPVILDEKRGDIGNTNNGYVKAAFDDLKADAVTVHPYLGQESLKPFLDRKDKGIIVLVQTSNPGAGEFQNLPVPASILGREAEEVFQKAGVIEDSSYGRIIKFRHFVAYRVSHGWNSNGNCAVVVGATYPKELAGIRSIVEDMPILIPGIGAQGGDVEAAVKAGKDSRNTGMIINSSRAIIFASKGPDFAQVARKATEQLRNEINQFRE